MCSLLLLTTAAAATTTTTTALPYLLITCIPIKQSLNRKPRFMGAADKNPNPQPGRRDWDWEHVDFLLWGSGGYIGIVLGLQRARHDYMGFYRVQECRMGWTRKSRDYNIGLHRGYIGITEGIYSYRVT